MYFDIKDLIEFYFETNLGQRTANSLTKTLTHLYDCEKSEMILGYGFTIPLLEPYQNKSNDLVSLMPGSQGAMSWPSSMRNVNLLVEESIWPIETESVDTVVILHGLEMSLSPDSLLTEVWRVLKASGNLFIFVANRAGFWARSDKTPFGYGRPYSLKQIESLLQETKFEIRKSKLAMNGFPADNNLFLNFLDITKLEMFSGVIAIRASKTVFAPEKLRADYFSFGVRKLLRPRSIA